MKRNVFSSSGKIIGMVELEKDKIIVKNNTKPILELYDKEIIDIFGSKLLNTNIVIKLYDEYFLTIGEIAAIFGVYYSHVNKITKRFCKTTIHQNRRNSSYGKTFSKERRKNIGKSRENFKIYNDGKKEYFIDDTKKIPNKLRKGRLPFSDEHKQKLSQAGLDGKYLSPSEISRRGWKNGKFNHVDFRKGIGGHFTSIKMNKTFFFRSLLELFYIINFVEENKDVLIYDVEPFKITCDDGTLYTPDLLINNNIVIELKSKNFLKNQPNVYNKFNYKKQQGEKYCKKNNLIYKVIYDEDIKYNLYVFKHILKESDLVTKYNIKFTNPERVYGQKK